MAMNLFKKMIMMANQKIDDKPSLPKEYMQLEYLESTGTQYILTNVYPNNTYTFDTKLKITTTGNIVPWGVRSIGSYNTNNSQCYLNYNSGGASKDIMLYSTNTGYPTNYNTGEQAVLGNTYDLRNMWVVNSMIQMTYPVILFGLNNIGTFNTSVGKCIIYRWTAYSKEIAVCDLIPALRIADSKPGMYDLVSGQFFTNQGTGEFVYSAYISAQIYINTILQSVVTGEELDNMDSLLYQISQSQEDLSSINTQLENIINT